MITPERVDGHDAEGISICGRFGRFGHAVSRRRIGRRHAARQVEFQVTAGTTCLCPVGTTGESPTLSHDEHERVIAEVVQAAAGRIKVMAGTGSNSTREALRLTRWAAKAGADAALMVAPYYNKPTQEGFYQHFRAVAEEVELPICVYNIPGRTGKNIEPETIARLAELDEHHDGQGGDRVAGSGFAGPGDHQPDRPER